MKKTDGVESIKGIGSKKATLLKQLGIETIEDFLLYFPFRYEDRASHVLLDEIRREDKVFSSGRIVSFQTSRPKPKMTITKITVCSELGKEGVITIFNNPYLHKQYSVGDCIQFYGMCQIKGRKILFSSPEIEPFGKNVLMNYIYPIYPLVKGLSNHDMVNAMRTILQSLGELEEVFPESLLQKRSLAPFDFAVRNIHFPHSVSALKSARYRLIYQEFFMLQMHLLNLRNKDETARSFVLKELEQAKSFFDKIPFELTNAQKRVLQEMTEDLKQEKPMQRLVQGDVGSGKTVLAWYATYLTFLNGYQTVLMAPTEVLAKQHYEGAKKLFEGSGVRIAFLSGSISKKKKEEIYQGISDGDYDLVIGTHAVIQEGVHFSKLALAITDEQHRFGVKQRGKLSKQYEISPHILVMTATPIPRTLTLVLQGDLDISIIDELPKGRKQIETYAIEQKKAHVVYGQCIGELQKGRQLYIVCPLVKESEVLDLKSAEELYESLKTGVFSVFRVGLLHGKMKSSEKTEMMRKYQEHEIDVLVSTTVIEVGINVPNATVMIIEDAQRFGLSQLHQLRGRVGRGSDQSYCYLIYRGYDQVVLKRMQVMTSTNDGFVIAEKDLEIRGPGEVLGVKQHGIPELKLADFTKHQKVMFASKEDIQELTDKRLVCSEQERKTLGDRVEETFQKKMEHLVMN